MPTTPRKLRQIDRLVPIGMTLLVIAATAFAGVALAAGNASSGDPPSVRTAWADPSTETVATVAANLTDLGTASEAAVGIRYRRNGTTNWSATSNRTVSQSSLVTFNLTDLASDTEYEYQAVTRTGNGADTGTIRTFSTPNESPVVTTDGTAAVTENDALLTGAVSDLGGAKQVTVRFAYRPVSSDSVTLTANQTMTAA